MLTPPQEKLNILHPFALQQGVVLKEKSRYERNLVAAFLLPKGASC